ncbi:MAG: type III-B CRISPR module RAMP protein Cmr4 [Desulfurococcales archaeon]|nr:type III-B CRISPR module RAMP protein Cmr4 [Desulfurococcales archaeon]
MRGVCGLTDSSPNAKLLVASALTPVHPGIGRAPGAVDLPVARDPLGFPLIRGSMVKGALKTRLGQTNDCVKGDTIKCMEKNGKSGEKNIGEQCKKKECCKICCLLGRELDGEGEGASAISIGDLYPILIPGPASIHCNSSLDKALRGVVYVTSDVLLARAQAYLEYANPGQNGGNNGFKQYLNQEEDALYLAGDCSGDITLLVAGQLIKAKCVKTENPSWPLNDLNGLNPLYKAYPPHERLLVLKAGTARMLINRLLDHVTRIALDRDTKTVRQGMLWTEEYLPWGTLFLGIVADTGFRNKKYCDHADLKNSKYALKALEDMLGSIGNTLVVGGKESIGSGILKLKMLKTI